MPSIKPFRALIPSYHECSFIVTRPLDNYSTGEARLIATENQYSFLHLIDPSLAEPSWRDMRAELIYRKIGLTIKQFLDSGKLIHQAIPAVYIYECIHNGLLQKGIWALCESDDYMSGVIRKHEVTVERREKQLAEYLINTGLDSNPVLITYRPLPVIDQEIDKYSKLPPLIDLLFNDGSQHRLWAVEDKRDIQAIQDAVASLDVMYIADGHHRAAAMKGRGQFSAVLMNTSEIKIHEFNRLIKGLNGLTAPEIIEKISETFDLTTSSIPVYPARIHEIGMYVNGVWYKLSPKSAILNQKNNPVENLDVSILQDHILAPILGISDPRTDARITFQGRLASESVTIQDSVDHGLFSIAFTLFPITVDELLGVADAGLIMPPKSTWIEPKFLVGLLTSYTPNSKNL